MAVLVKHLLGRLGPFAHQTASLSLSGLLISRTAAPPDVLLQTLLLFPPAWAESVAHLVLLPRVCSSFIIYRTPVNHPTPGTAGPLLRRREGEGFHPRPAGDRKQQHVFLRRQAAGVFCSFAVAFVACQSGLHQCCRRSGGFSRTRACICEAFR